MKNARLMQARIEANLTQEELAKIVKVGGKQTISNWENGVSQPRSLSTAIKVSEVLNKDVIFLFGNKVQEIHTIEAQKQTI